MANLKQQEVCVKLNDGQCYAGTFICIDAFLNVVLESVILWDSIQQVQTNSTNSLTITENEVFSQVFIRGNNVCYVAPLKKDDEQSEHENNNTGFKINKDEGGKQNRKDDNFGEDQIN